MKENMALFELLKKEGYTDLRYVTYEGREVVCGLGAFIYTTGLVIDMDETGYAGRYCFHRRADAKEVLENLLEIPSDLKIPGDWIKFKGKVEVYNENCSTFVS